MILYPSLRYRYLACSEKSLVAWDSRHWYALFAAAVTLRYLSVIIEGSSSTRDHVGDSNSLDVVSKGSYVISLPRRTDRRLQMDRLRDALHLNWTYRDACEANRIRRDDYPTPSTCPPQPIDASALNQVAMHARVTTSLFPRSTGLTNWKT